MITIQWVVYMVVGCCACFGVLFLLYSFMAKQTAKHKEKITFIESLYKHDSGEAEEMNFSYK